METTIYRDQIIALEAQLIAAIKSRDYLKLGAILHDDLLFVIPNGQTVTKAMDIANLQSGDLNIVDIAISEQEINLIEDCAIVSVMIVLKGDYLKQTIDGTYKYIRVWKLLDGSWKVIGGAGVPC